MILLNKFIFGDLDQFKKNLIINITPYVPASTLLKKFIAYYDYKSIYLCYYSKKLHVDKINVSFMDDICIKHENMKLRVRFKYEKNFGLFKNNVSVAFNGVNGRLCTLAIEPLRCHYGAIFSFSDDNSIKNVLNIIRNY